MGYSGGDYVIFCTLLSPSLNFVLFIYSPMFMISCALLATKYGGWSAVDVVGISGIFIVSVLYTNLIFYILQDRELTRYF